MILSFNFILILLLIIKKTNFEAKYKEQSKKNIKLKILPFRIAFVAIAVSLLLSIYSFSSSFFSFLLNLTCIQHLSLFNTSVCSAHHSSLSGHVSESDLSFCVLGSSAALYHQHIW